MNILMDLSETKDQTISALSTPTEVNLNSEEE